MSGVALCTDSSAQLPPHLVTGVGLDVVPMGIVLDDRDHDESDLDVDAFYEALARGSRATTSHPSPGRFAEAYEAALARGAAEVLSIHLGSRISGTVGAAELAAKTAPLPIEVVDTGTASFGVGICVLAAAAIVASGGSGRDASRAIEELVPAIGNVFALADAPGGRIPVPSGPAAVPVLSFAGGETLPVDEARTFDEAALKMLDHITRREGRLRVAVGHAAPATAAAADLLVTELARAEGVVDVLRYRVGPSVGVHTGGLSFGAFWWPAAA